MAALKATVSGTTDVSLTASVTKTVMNIAAPANQRVKILGWGIYFIGTAASNTPANVSLTRQGNAGTGSTVTPNTDDGDISLATNTTAKENMTVEPSSGNVIKTIKVHTQFGYEVTETPGSEPVLEAGGFLGISVNAPEAVSCRGWMRIEE